ncbi:hypothetical protein PG997_005483 [Apiospora hydei]|uniref:DUF6546 domain-containing protein n=1 Tax=Apiospora hydei TaxID=1337664 RepID=A0ABR1WL38_9PEZI
MQDIALYKTGLASVFQDALPRHLKMVSIFEEFNPQLEAELDRRARRSGHHVNQYLGEFEASGDDELEKALSRSYDLEHLSASFLITAERFIYAHFSHSSMPLPGKWHRLRSLARHMELRTQSLGRQGVGKEGCFGLLPAECRE